MNAGGLVFPSRLGLGTWQFCGAAPGLPSPEEAGRIFRAAVGLGVRHLDTAQSYGNGASETVVSGLVADRPEYFVATKIHYRPTAAETLEAVEQSRKRLGRDVIDLIYLHWPRKGLDVRPVMEGLEEARSRGFIRRVGVSNFSVAHLEAASEVCRVDAHQMCYNLLWRYPERDVIPWCRGHGTAVVVYSALAQGLLAGRIRGKEDLLPGDPRAGTLYYRDEVFPKVHEAVREMSARASAAGETLAHLALAWVLSRPGVSASLVGAKSEAQIRETLSFDYEGFPDRRGDVLSELTGISDAVHPFIPDVGNIFGVNT